MYGRKPTRRHEAVESSLMHFHCVDTADAEVNAKAEGHEGG